MSPPSRPMTTGAPLLPDAPEGRKATQLENGQTSMNTSGTIEAGLACAWLLSTDDELMVDDVVTGASRI